MWEVLEHRKVAKQCKKLPLEILKRYEKWKDIVALSGPEGLLQIKGFNDEALKGDWQGYRSSRLNLQYRVIYKIVGNEVLIQVFEITPHDYRKQK